MQNAIDSLDSRMRNGEAGGSQVRHDRQSRCSQAFQMGLLGAGMATTLYYLCHTSSRFPGKAHSWTFTVYPDRRGRASRGWAAGQGSFSLAVGRLILREHVLE